MSRRVAAGVLLTAMAASLYGHVPPERRVREAMAAGHTAFLGRVVKLEEVSIAPHEAVMKMHVTAMRCYYGDCCDKQPATLTYVSESFKDSELPVRFEVGREILFILATSIACGGPERRFDSRFGPAMDFAYLGSSLPRYPAEAEATTFTSVYWDKVRDEVTYASLDEWGRARSQPPGEHR